MSDYQDENPYASPNGAAEPWATTVEEIHGAWRDKDELVLLPGETKAPKACWITSQSIKVGSVGITCPTIILNWMYFLTVVPVAGWILFFFGRLILTLTLKQASIRGGCLADEAADGA